jgi:hypothetical protein
MQFIIPNSFAAAATRLNKTLTGDRVLKATEFQVNFQRRADVLPAMLTQCVIVAQARLTVGVYAAIVPLLMRTSLASPVDTARWDQTITSRFFHVTLVSRFVGVADQYPGKTHGLFLRSLHSHHRNAMRPSRRQIRSEERCLPTGQTSHMANHASAATATMPATVNAGLYIVPIAASIAPLTI